ncbi:MAG: response regulator [Elusimicrobiota bacterium]|nr:response regulator [Elusimicrobiota bacterium]
MTVKQKILIVDDKKENIVALRHVLREVEAEVIEANNGNEALAATLHHDFAVGLLDVQMPGMNGFELAELLRGEERTRELPIIFLSAADCDAEYLFKGYQAGAVDFMLKPFDHRVLVSKVEVFLRLDRQGRELKEALRQLSERTVELKDLVEELESFSYAVSHDLKAPLRSIDGFTRAILESQAGKLDEQGIQDFNRVRAAAQRMGLLIDGLLELSRITRHQLKTRPVDITAIACEVAARLKDAEHDRNVEFVIAPGLCAEADEHLLRAVLENLIGNAWKYTSKKPSARIEVGSLPGDGRTVYFVRDDGAGFDMAYADKLFSAFQRLHRSADFTGMGIGLATVKRIVVRHGGRIWAEAAPGKGAAFFFTL